MEIIKYREEYKQQIIDLILHIQNEEAGINLQIGEQPDLLNIPLYYEKKTAENSGLLLRTARLSERSH